MSYLLRERFEAEVLRFAPAEALYRELGGRNYIDKKIQWMWWGWQAALAADAPPPDLRVDANGNECSADPCADHGSHYSIPAPPPDRNDLLGGQGGRTADPPATQRHGDGGES